MKHLTPIDILGCMIASLGHDAAHPAFTNRYLITTKHKLSLKYNDQSILENMHCSLTSTMMNETDLLDELSETE
jgi:3',5'-cyclic-nucleotide phosphodiesterase